MNVSINQINILIDLLHRTYNYSEETIGKWKISLRYAVVIMKVNTDKHCLGEAQYSDIDLHIGTSPPPPSQRPLGQFSMVVKKKRL